VQSYMMPYMLASAYCFEARHKSVGWVSANKSNMR
jgi:hypothetical protein